MGQADRCDARGRLNHPARRESRLSIEKLDETMDLPGLKMFFFGMTDLSRVLADSRKPDWESPKLWQFVDRAVRKGRERGIVGRRQYQLCLHHGRDAAAREAAP
jgi:2-keto-3-deoxy-L-rhamnonate aldolase RhmA